MRMVPSSTGKLPATALRSVDFPEPFVPMTIRNEPSSRARSTPWSARTSFGVSPLKVLRTPRTSSTRSPPQPLAEPGQHEGGEHEERGDELQIVRFEARAKRDGDEQPEQQRPHDRAADNETERLAPDQRLADDDA